MCPPEAFLPARHLGSSPTHQPCHRAWYHHHTGCKERPLFAEGVQGQQSAQPPQRWTCQREALAVPAATCKPSRQLPLSFQKTPQAQCHAGHQSSDQEPEDHDFIDPVLWQMLLASREVTQLQTLSGGFRWPTSAVCSSGLVSKYFWGSSFSLPPL